MQYLKIYHSKYGILVDDFIEKTFSWDLDSYYLHNNKHGLPYNKDWIGFLHNPPNVPDWFYKYHHPESILGRELFQISLQKCKCIVTLSDYLKNWLSNKVDVPIISVKHPTGYPNLYWNYRKFINGSKKILQLGYWLRDFDAICRLKTPNGYVKYLMPSDHATYNHLAKIREACSSESPHEVKNKWSNTTILSKLSNDEFDTLLSNSIVYLKLYDSSANNAIIECVARNTPIIVNPIPPVIEYLGPNYPLYAETEEVGTSILYDIEKIYRAHTYLKNMNKEWLDGRFFAHDVYKKVNECLM
jgi:hypothetical protein